MILYNTSNDAQWHKYIFSGIQSTVCRSRYLLLGSYIYDVVAFHFLLLMMLELPAAFAILILSNYNFKKYV